MGNTIIESARSEEATADAVKAIISTAKGELFSKINLLIDSGEDSPHWTRTLN